MEENRHGNSFNQTHSHGLTGVWTDHGISAEVQSPSLALYTFVLVAACCGRCRGTKCEVRRSCVRCSAENTCSDVLSVGGQRATGARGSFFRVGIASVSWIHSPPAPREPGGLLPPCQEVLWSVAQNPECGEDGDRHGHSKHLPPC